MPAARTLLLACVCWISLCGAGFAQTIRNIPLPTERYLDRYGVTRAWWNQAVLNPSKDTIRSISLDEQQLYVVATSGAVTSFDAITGQRLWAGQFGLENEFVFEIASDDDMAFILAGASLHGVRKRTGESLFIFTLGDYPSAAPAIDADNIYIASADGSVRAYDWRRLQSLSEERKLPDYSEVALRWRRQTGQRIYRRPVTIDRTVFVAGDRGSLYAISTETGEVRYQFETDTGASAPLAEALGSIYFATRDLVVYGFDADTGILRWEFVSRRPIEHPPQAIGEDLYLLPVRGGIHSIDAVAGLERWRNPKPTQFLSAGLDIVYASDQSGDLVMLSRKEGTTLATIPLRSFEVRLSNDLTDWVYMATENGLVMCLRPQASEYPLYHKHPEARPLLPEFEEETPKPPEPEA